MAWQLSWLECCPLAAPSPVSRGIVEVRVRISAILNFLSFLFATAQVASFTAISSWRGSKIWDSYFHHFMLFLHLPFVSFLFVELERRLWVMERLQRNVWGATGQKEPMLEGKVTTLPFIPLPLPPTSPPPQKKRLKFHRIDYVTVSSNRHSTVRL